MHRKQEHSFTAVPAPLKDCYSNSLSIYGRVPAPFLKTKKLCQRLIVNHALLQMNHFKWTFFSSFNFDFYMFEFVTLAVIILTNHKADSWFLLLLIYISDRHTVAHIYLFISTFIPPFMTLRLPQGSSQHK